MSEVTQAKNKDASKSYADPFSAFRAEMDRMFHNFLQTPAFSMPLPFTGAVINGVVTPTTDMKESDSEYTIAAELPGLSEPDVEVSVHNGSITIKGQKSEEKKDEKSNYHLTERRYGEFQRSFRIPDNVDEAKIKAAFDKGVLTITMPKGKDGGPQKRQIKIGA